MKTAKQTDKEIDNQFFFLRQNFALSVCAHTATSFTRQYVQVSRPVGGNTEGGKNHQPQRLLSRRSAGPISFRALSGRTDRIRISRTGKNVRIFAKIRLRPCPRVSRVFHFRLGTETTIRPTENGANICDRYFSAVHVTGPRKRNDIFGNPSRLSAARLLYLKQKNTCCPSK